MPKTASKTKSPPMVRVHNRRGGAPAHFRAPGAEPRDVRLGPGESVVLPENCLNTHELKALCDAGIVTVEPEKSSKRAGAKPVPRTSKKTAVGKAVSKKTANRKRRRSQPTASVPKKGRTR